jgi:hypothetical protein
MKTPEIWLVATVFLLAGSQSAEVQKKVDAVVSEAIKGIVHNYFAVKEPKIDLYFCGPKSETLAENLLREKPQDVIFSVKSFQTIESAVLSSPSILLFDSYDDFYKFFVELGKVSTPKPNFLFYIPRKGNQSVILDYAAKSDEIENANFIDVVNGTTVDLVTSFLFEPGKCKLPQYKTINRFSTDNMKWDNDTFYPEKYGSYHGCPLFVGLLNIDDNTTLPMATKTSHLIFHILAKELNFRNISSVMDKTNVEKYDLFNILFYQHSISFEYFDFSPALYTDHVTLTVPAGEPYTQLEKMFLMFDKETWICIGVTLVGSLLVIQVINFMSVQIQKFVFGRDIRTPSLNVASVFLVGGQNRLPGRNFARFMLMMFIIWSLIIRTCYQSMLYKNLQRDMRRPRITTFEELNEKNFSIVVDHGYDDIFGEEFVNRSESVQVTRIFNQILPVF